MRRDTTVERFRASTPASARSLPGPHLPPAQLLAARLRVLGPDPLALAKEFPVDRTGSRRLRQLPVVGDARNRRRPDIFDANLHAQPNSTPDFSLSDLISQ